MPMRRAMRMIAVAALIGILGMGQQGHAGRDVQGRDVQGVELQGREVQGVELQGRDVQGVELQGRDVQGMELQDSDVLRAFAGSSEQPSLCTAQPAPWPRGMHIVAGRRVTAADRAEQDILLPDIMSWHIERWPDVPRHRPVRILPDRACQAPSPSRS